MSTGPYIFDEFFASGREESISPFLMPSSRKWGKNLSLKSASFSALLLLFAFTSSFFNPTLSSFFLVFVYFLVGTPALIGTFEDLKNLEINIDVLMTSAALLSVLIGSGLEGGLLLVLFELSAAMENMVTQKTKSALIHLNQLAPRLCTVVADDGTLFEQSVRETTVGTTLLVKAGEIVPLDGKVIEGRSSVNLSHLTGESHPIFKQPEDDVPAGALNLEGALTMRVTRSSADSTLRKIIDLITHAQEAKPRLEKMIDRFGKKYATTIMLLFFLFAIGIPLFTAIPYLGKEGGIYRALTFLIAASPCALVLATPTAYLSAISACTRRGILLKGGVIFDALARCKKIAFDKTGTLTTGQLVCFSFRPISEKPIYSEEIALSIAHALERNAVHPIADAIIRYAIEQETPPHQIAQFRSIPGSGLEADVELKSGRASVILGSREFILSKYPNAPIENVIQTGHLLTFLLIDKSLFVFEFVDAIRPQAKSVVQKLKEQNLDLLMLTGDKHENAEFVAKEVGIDQVHADLRPEDKLEKVASLSQQDGLIMVGDGVNDAPALARATVGISLGKVGSATAVDASDVVLLQDDLALLPWLNSKARKTHRIIKQNLALSLSVILFATTPALLGFIPLWLAVILHEGGTVLVGLNSLRLLKSEGRMQKAEV